MNKNLVLVYDFETDSADPEFAHPVELGAKVFDPVTLKWIPNSEFNVHIKPVEDVYDEEYINHPKHKSTIAWHAKLHKCSTKDILDKWDKGIQMKQAFADFKNYTKKYHTKKSSQTKWTAPIPAGYNIIRYDEPIMDRYIEEFKLKYLFHPTKKLDGIDMIFQWFHHNNELQTPSGKESYAMDTLRPYFGIPADASHTAIYDVEQEGELIIRLLRMIRVFANKVGFKDSWTVNNV